MRIGHDSKLLTHVDTKKLNWFVLSGTKNDLKLDISQPQKDRNMGCRKISEHVISSHTAINMFRHFLGGFSSTKNNPVCSNFAEATKIPRDGIAHKATVAVRPLPPSHSAPVPVSEVGDFLEINGGTKTAEPSNNQ